MNRILKEGDNAFVFKMTHKETNEAVAIKQLKKKFYGWDEVISLKEIESLRRINHPNVIKLKEVIKNQDQLCLVFELMEGNLESQYHMVKGQNNGIPEKFIRKVLYDIALSLEEIHKHNLVHRNLCFQNIFYKGKNFKLGDFAQSRVLKMNQPPTEYVYNRNYRAPEVIMRIGYGKEADIFNLGCLMVELYNGKPAFQASSSDVTHILQLAKLLGTHQFEDWSNAHKWLSSQGIYFNKQKPMNLQTVVPDASHEALLLLTELLRVDPERRIKARDITRHPFFTKYDVHLDSNLEDSSNIYAGDDN